MGYVKEPKNVDLVVGPSILTEDTKDNIARAIAQYRETGKKPDSVEIAIRKPVRRTKRAKTATAHF
jgi:hypothetical protein